MPSKAVERSGVSSSTTIYNDGSGIIGVVEVSIIIVVENSD